MNFNEVIKSEKPVLVDFYATWCGPCKMMNPILEQVAKQMGEDAKILKIDIDKNPQAATFFKISGVPTLIIFQSGQIKWRQSGVIPAGQLVSLLRGLAPAPQA
jgi:thioredoxin 1